MALVLKDRVRQTSTTAGTGTITLSGSVAGYQNFSVIGTGNTTYYTIADQSGSNWEVGIGTYTSPNQLSRSTILASSNAGAIVNFGAGTKDVFITLPAEEAVYLNEQNIYAPNAIVSKNIITVDDTAASGFTAVLGVDANGYAVIGGGSSLFGAIDNAILAPQGLQLGDSNTAILTLNAAPTTNYSLNFPPAAGSNNQLLKTDGAGNLGWMDLGSPPAIGGTTPNTITGTTVSATTQITLPTITVGNSGTGVLQMVDGLDGYDYLNIYTYDPGGNVQVKFPAGIQVTGGIDIGTGLYTGGYALFLGTGGGSSGSIALRGGTVTNDITIQAPASPSVYTLTLPTTAGSANQVLKTDGSGNLSWSTQGVQGTAPVTVTATTYTVAATDQWIIGNRAGTITLTLPTASSNTGRSLNVKTITANTVVSASSNVVPLVGGAAGTAILTATAGKFATLVSDGTNWIIMAGN